MIDPLVNTVLDGMNPSPATILWPGHRVCAIAHTNGFRGVCIRTCALPGC